jgi:RNA polymerase sigma-70 factor (ECF subfamily)
MQESPSDEQLLAHIAQGSEPALEALYDRHARSVYALARKILRSTGDAEEVLQDVFVRVWKRAGEFDTRRGSSTAWLMTLAHHAAIDAYRRLRPNAQNTPLDDLTVNTLAPTEHPDDRRLERLAAAQALDTLEASERLVVEGLYYTGLSHTQLAAQIGMPLGTLKTRARNALLRLRAHFQTHTANDPTAGDEEQP